MKGQVVCAGSRWSAGIVWHRLLPAEIAILLTRRFLEDGAGSRNEDRWKWRDEVETGPGKGASGCVDNASLLVRDGVCELSSVQNVSAVGLRSTIESARSCFRTKLCCPTNIAS